MSTRHQEPQTGSAYIIAMIVVIALAALASAFIESGTVESRGNIADGNLTRVLSIAEAGLNTAIADVNGGGTGALGSVDAQIAFGGGTYYVISEDLGNDTVRLLAVGDMNGIRRALEAILAPERYTLFSHALFGDLDLGAKGTIFTDSYDSEKGDYASQVVNTHTETGLSYAEANGSLGSNGDITIRGGAIILGNATPGPGHTVTISGGEVYIEGSTAPAEAASVLPAYEYEPVGAVLGPFLPDFPETYEFVDGTYRYSKLSVTSKSTVVFKGQVVLYVDGDFNISSQTRVIVAPDSKVTIYHGGDSFKLTGQGLLNETNLPEAFKLFTVAESVEFVGNSGFYGVIFAPNGHIKPSGTTDIYGSFVGREIDILGTADFHYDAQLSRADNERMRLRLVSWRRVAPPEL